MSLQTEVVKVVVVAQESVLDDGIKCVHDVFPDRLATDILALLHIRVQTIATEEVVNNHVALVAWHTGSLPGEPLSADNSPVQWLAQKDLANTGPDSALLGKSLSLAHLADLTFQSEELSDVSNHADSVTGTTSLIQTLTGLGAENMAVLKPVLEGLARQMRAQLGDKQVAELGVLALSEDLPHITVTQCNVTGDLELEQVVLVGVQVNCVDTTRVLLEVIQDVVTGTGDCQDDIVRANVEQSVINTRILPGKCVDVFVLELSVLGKHVIVVDSVMVVLVERGRERQVSAQVDNSGLVGLGADLARALLNSLLPLELVVRRRQVRRFGEGSVKSLNGILVGVRSHFLGATNEDVVRNTTQKIVTITCRYHSSEFVLEVVPTSSLQAHAVEIEPSSPEDTTNPVNMAVEGTASVVARRDVDDALN